jgi:hypothetical protein
MLYLPLLKKNIIYFIELDDVHSLIITFDNCCFCFYKSKINRKQIMSLIIYQHLIEQYENKSSLSISVWCASGDVALKCVYVRPWQHMITAKCIMVSPGWIVRVYCMIGLSQNEINPKYPGQWHLMLYTLSDIFQLQNNIKSILM